MRILHVTTYLQGGAGRAITDLAEAQRARGDEVTLVATEQAEPGYGNYPEYLERLGRAGVDVRLVDSTFTRDWVRVLRAAADTHSALSSTPDLIHSHAGVPSVVALLVSGMRCGVPVVQTMHGWAADRRLEHATADVLAMRATAAVAVPSHAALAQLEAAGLPSTHVHVIPYGIAPLDPRDGPDDDVSAVVAGWKTAGRQVLCCIGTIGARKNQRALLDAIGSSKARDQVGVLLVGEGDLTSIQDALARWQLADAVLVTGYRPRAARMLAVADWLVLPSQREGLPLAVLEAYRAGRPAIVAGTPELREVVEHERTGVVAAGTDPHALAAALEHAVSLPAADRHAWGETAAQRWRDCYRLVTMVARYDAFYAAAGG